MGVPNRTSEPLPAEAAATPIDEEFGDFFTSGEKAEYEPEVAHSLKPLEVLPNIDGPTYHLQTPQQKARRAHLIKLVTLVLAACTALVAFAVYFKLRELEEAKLDGRRASPRLTEPTLASQPKPAVATAEALLSAAPVLVAPSEPQPVVAVTPPSAESTAPSSEPFVAKAATAKSQITKRRPAVIIAHGARSKRSAAVVMPAKPVGTKPTSAGIVNNSVAAFAVD